MGNYKETFETWNKIAELYQDRFMHLDLYNETYDLILDSITKDKVKILEIGCGPGNITKYLLSKRPNLNIFGIDISPNMIALAEKNNPEANFAVMDARKISQLRTTTYDGIIFGFCLPYLSQNDSTKLISNCSRLLNQNGLIYLSFVEGEPQKSGFQVGSSGDRMFFYFHKLEKLTEQLSNNDFKEIKTCNVVYNKAEDNKETHTILTAKKRTGKHPF